MRFAFAGTAPFAELVLTACLRRGRAAGRRGHQPRPAARPPRHAAAAAHQAQGASAGIPVLQPARVSAPEAVAALLRLGRRCSPSAPTARSSAAPLLEAVPAIVIHPSLVPHWRGAAPVERALMAGETELGVADPQDDARAWTRARWATCGRVHVPADADAGRAYELLAPAAVDGPAGHARTASPTAACRWRAQRGEPTYAPKIEARRQAHRLGPPGVDDRQPGARPVAAHRRRHGAAGQAHVRVARGGGRRAPCPAPGRRGWPCRPATAGWTCSSCSRRAARAWARPSSCAAPGAPWHVSRAARGPPRAGAAPVSPARLLRARSCVRLRAGGRCDESLAALPELEGLGERDRALANELVVGTVKRRGSLDAVLGGVREGAAHRAPTRDVLEALRLAAFQLLFLDRVPGLRRGGRRGRAGAPAGRAHAGLRQRRAAAGGGRGARAASPPSREGDGARAWAVRYSCPEWLVRLLRAGARRRGGGARSWPPPSSLPSAACA